MVSYIIGIVGIVGIMVLWTLVQIVWKKVFADSYTNGDALADRDRCGNCGNGGSCGNNCEIPKHVGPN